MDKTDELRRLLDEREIFWIDIPRDELKRTCFKSSDDAEGYCYFDECRFGTTELAITDITPAQAIAAALASCRCTDDGRTEVDG